MKIRLIRHATLIVETGNFKLLIDPMLSDKYEMEPVQNAPDSTRIPMTELPFGNRELMNMLKKIDAVLVTHIHRDHWDMRAKFLLNKSLPVLCQPVDEKEISGAGFDNVFPIPSRLEWNELSVYRTNGLHGTGEIGAQMGHVSGFLISHKDEPNIYIAGDTIFCDQVKDALTRYMPEVTVINAGSAQFSKGAPITMNLSDIAALADFAPYTKIVAVHMDTVNHCLLKRDDLIKFVKEKKLTERVLIPNDGEEIHF